MKMYGLQCTLTEQLCPAVYVDESFMQWSSRLYSQRRMICLCWNLHCLQMVPETLQR